MTHDQISTDSESNTSATKPLSRWGTILGSLGCGLGLVGFLVGMYDQPSSSKSRDFEKSTVHELEQSQLAPAPSYKQIDSQRHGVNNGWRSEFSKLVQNNPGLFDRVVRTPEMKSEALNDRLRTRAFDGAPPAIPHPVDQRTAESCLACLDGKLHAMPRGTSEFDASSHGLEADSRERWTFSAVAAAQQF
jgi:hypothetical protein